jgi:hypothetical protein
MCLCLEEGEGAGLRTDVLQQRMRGRSADIIAMCSSAVLLLLLTFPCRILQIELVDSFIFSDRSPETSADSRCAKAYSNLEYL